MCCDASWVDELLDWAQNCRDRILCQGAIWNNDDDWVLFCTLMYINMNGDKNLNRRYEEEAISWSVKEFQTQDVHISNDVPDSDGPNRYGCIVPAVLNALQFIIVI